MQVEQIVAVVDAGRLVNPAIARQQIEGGLVFGLAAAVGATTDYDGGVATARKLGQLGLPRLSQVPQIVVEFIDSDRDPGGVGEDLNRAPLLLAVGSRLMSSPNSVAR